jgi:hypothetical protein
VDILVVAAVIKVCRMLGCCEDPYALASRTIHSVDGNSMRSKVDMGMIPAITS